MVRGRRGRRMGNIVFVILMGDRGSLRLAMSSQWLGWTRLGSGFSKPRRMKLIQCTFEFELNLEGQISSRDH
jgi:hypothetical protein